jgi:hypothetical protein
MSDVLESNCGSWFERAAKTWWKCDNPHMLATFGPEVEDVSESALLRWNIGY